VIKRSRVKIWPDIILCTCTETDHSNKWTCRNSRNSLLGSVASCIEVLDLLSSKVYTVLQME